MPSPVRVEPRRRRLAFGGLAPRHAVSNRFRDARASPHGAVALQGRAAIARRSAVSQHHRIARIT
ncbi:hypothetical protein BURPS1710A_A0114 [Burkholderia pseudomallei 1710a]|uniref:Uncharacterized protein n=1 Tax=Burkholderia pseudomallei 1710a TaxID=320371 RepID=A0A0E1VUA7_BURPE|nr:hypothetical protein BURPS1710A_A0114 [Burkholderia pseudomallei 1710a]